MPFVPIPEVDLMRALRESNGSLDKAALLLGVSDRTVQRYMDRYGIELRRVPVKRVAA